MYPVICKIGPLTVYSYGFLMAIAVIVCSWLAGWEAKRLSIKPDVVYDLAFWVVLAGILGARIFFVLLNLDFFVKHPFEILMLQNGGLAWQGGLLAGAGAGILYIKIKRLPLWAMTDFVAPYVALGQAIGRLGCFLNGCCYGREVSWGIYFPVHDAHLHPTQLYDAVGLVAIFFILKAIQKVSKTSGRIFTWYLILASLQRFVIEFFRADHTIVFGGLSIFQIVSFTIFLAGLAVASLTRKR